MGKEHLPSEKSRAKVMMMKSCDLSNKTIAALMDISLNTLKKHYKNQLKVGKEEANFRVASSLFKRAQGGNVTACIFWLKSRAGWREVQVVEGSFTGKGGASLVPVINLTVDDGLASSSD